MLSLKQYAPVEFSHMDFSLQRRILLVDDDPQHLHILAVALGNAGYNVSQATHGQDALATLTRALPDLVLLDIAMPELDGYAVCRQLKAHTHTRDIPVIFLTGYGELADKVKGFQLGAVDYITKPFMLPEVLARVSTHLAIYRQQRCYRQQIAKLQQQIARQHTTNAAPGATIDLPDYSLTQRERQVLAMIADGHTCADIAAQMVITKNTVRWYLKKIYTKLGVNHKADAIAKARAMGL